MAYQPSESLQNRTFVGLMIAQFLAGFNDQAIHASAMFYALHTGAMDEANAISTMPILFFAPWGIFCTLAGYCADRFSKTYAIRIWKFSEILISLVLVLGFYLGTERGMPVQGAWIVLFCVFLMGTHAAFFNPAKYSAMPEILQPHVLSKGNGVLESTTFLSTILGTVAGGLLSGIFRGQEVWIGVFLLGLSVLGSLASLMVDWLPAANPTRAFPTNVYKPLWENTALIFRVKPLVLAVFGIAFFIFMVSYMRATMYMHGQSQQPKWGEFLTSVYVATVALGVGFGAPLAGNLSGGKVELGLVPVGCIGMILATILAALFISSSEVLVVTLIITGFFSGFYMVPLYTLLQHRAPKDRKGDIVATSNFINVVGAISATLLFLVLVRFCQAAGITPEVPHLDKFAAVVESVEKDEHGEVKGITVKKTDGELVEFRSDAKASGLEIRAPRLSQGETVKISEYTLGGVPQTMVRPVTMDLPSVYDNLGLPRYLFLGASLMAVGILALLVYILPDFFVRGLFGYRSLGKYAIRAVAMEHLPTSGPVVLLTNAKTLHGALQLISVTDRATKMVLIEEGTPQETGTWLRRLALGKGALAMNAAQPTDADWARALASSQVSLKHRHILAVTVDALMHDGRLSAFLNELHQTYHVSMIPVYCGSLDEGSQSIQRIRVVFGEAFTGVPSPDQARQRLSELADQVRKDDVISTAKH